ncbi:MAG: hypothetical protein D6831_03590 [Aquificota bacterium]|nr:MAG: hypothetical protein D6831_03590 [Aquificota bacterium]
MKIKDYIEQGLKNRVEEKPEDYELLGSAKEGVHKVECYIKANKGKIVDAKYTSSKRCDFLLAFKCEASCFIVGQLPLHRRNFRPVRT